MFPEFFYLIGQDAKNNNFLALLLLNEVKNIKDLIHMIGSISINTN